jgi:sugar (pentulose or hexulose) kinase
VWVGIDVGTQSVRAAAVTETGMIRGSGRSPLRSHRDGDRHEQDPEEWWRAAGAACRQALAEASGRDGEPVTGVAVDATSGTILLVDGRGRPLTAGIMYDDARAVEEAEAVSAAGAAVWSDLGYRMQPSWALPKLVWLVGHGHAPPGCRLAHQADIITRRLVGQEVATDSSNALKTGYHLLEDRWPFEVIDALGVPAAVLPPVVIPGTVLGGVGPSGAEVTGLPEGTPVVAGMTDGCAAQIGAGALAPGAWHSVLGTTLVLKGVTEVLVRDPTGVVYSHRHPDGGWLPGGASSTGAGTLDQHYAGRDLGAQDEAASEREPAGAITYPLAGRGERFPFLVPDAEGFLLGEPADEVDHYAALLQGVAFVERLCFDHLDHLGAAVDGRLTFSGGATNSRYWCQLRADVLGRPVHLPASAEPAFGMAVLAARGTGAAPTVAETASRMVRMAATVEPRPDRQGLFVDAYLRLVDELGRRGWLDDATVAHCHRRAH